MEYRSKLYLNALITANPDIFRLGNTVSGNFIRSIFAVQRPLLVGSESEVIKSAEKYHLGTLSAYTRLNRLLRRRGLTLRKEHDNFIIEDYEGQHTVVDSYAKAAVGKQRRKTTLRNGLREYRGIWSPLSDAELIQS